jgi:hypothetical protein
MTPDQIAVTNFLCSLEGLTEGEALCNLSLDADSYGWSAATCRAIRAGIADHFAACAPTLRDVRRTAELAGACK